MLVRLIYASLIAPNISPAVVRDILATSQRNNAKVGVTGALIFTGGAFLQCLEGHRREVNKVYNRILNDPRHTDPALISLVEIPSRRFTGWNMGYVASTERNQHLFLKHCPTPTFDPFALTAASAQALLDDLVDSAKWLGQSVDPQH